jgi:enoyl-CoA hydratase
MSDDLLFSVEQHIGLITLNRPQALNALTHAMILALHEQLETWAADDNIHALVIQATAGRAFCAGGDVRGLFEAGRRDPTEPLSFFRHEYRLNHFIHQLKKPYLAFMDGFTFGGGVGISLHGSHPVASERFLMAMPETSIGFFPDIGASHLLTRCPGAYGMYLALTGQRLDASLAKSFGLVRAVIPSETWPLVLASLIETDLSTQAHERVNTCLMAYAQESASASEHAHDIATCFDKPHLEHIFLALKALDNPWAQETLALLSEKSPMSLQVTFMQIKRAQGMSLLECLTQDYSLAYHFMKNSDFYEGVRALLIDKDKSPHWKPAALQSILPKDVAAYFIPPPSDIIPLWSPNG